MPDLHRLQSLTDEVATSLDAALHCHVPDSVDWLLKAAEADAWELLRGIMRARARIEAGTNIMERT